MPLPVLIKTRDELLARDLIAHEVRLRTVLSLLPLEQRRRSEAGAGLMQLGELLRGADELPHPNEKRNLP
jgi:hypothetical protein